MCQCLSNLTPIRCACFALHFPPSKQFRTTDIRDLQTVLHNEIIRALTHYAYMLFFPHNDISTDPACFCETVLGVFNTRISPLVARDYNVFGWMNKQQNPNCSEGLLCCKGCRCVCV